MSPESFMSSIERSVRELTNTTRDLTIIQRDQLVRLRRQVIGIVILGALIFGLVVFALFSIFKLQELERRSKVNFNNIVDIQARTSNEVLCPLYKTFLNFYNPQSTSARENPDVYDESFKVIENGARTLGCPVQRRRIRP